MLVATVRSLKMSGGVARADLGTEDAGAVARGCANLGRHLENLRGYGLPVLVAINRFDGDSAAELEAVRAYVEGQGAEVHLCTHWAEGGAGTEALARRVAEVLTEGAADFAPLYPDAMGLVEKIETVARRIYRAEGVDMPAPVRAQLAEWEAAGFAELPVCMAKTQYSFSADPSLRGAPEGFRLPVREVRLSAGAGFVVAICGEIMTMPGLPRVPAAEAIGLNAAGEVEGLF